MAQLIGALSHEPKITGQIPSQGTAHIASLNSGWGVFGRQPMDVSLSLPLSSSF